MLDMSKATEDSLEALIAAIRKVYSFLKITQGIT